jgi:hypothetical protein
MKYIFKFIFICVIINAHSIEAQIKRKVKTDVRITSVNFFDKKFFKIYQLVIDESNVSEHPFIKYLDCQNEGYFCIHFIPKNKILQDFWKNEYFKINKEYDNSELNNKNIKVQIENNYNLYSIFCYHIKKEFLNISNGCSEESIFTKNKCVADIYQFNSIKKKWEFVSKNKSEILPPYFDNDFFIKKFPNLFEKKEIQIIKPKKSINGFWQTNCRNQLTQFDINDNQGFMSLYSDNAIFIDVEIVNSIGNENEFYLRFKNTNNQRNYYKDKKHTVDEEISKTENIAKLTLKEKTIIMDWYGLYNINTNSRDFVKECVFVRENGGKNPVVLVPCEDK